MQRLGFSTAIRAEKLHFLMASVGFARIDPGKRPIDLFRVWRDEAIKFHVKLVDACCLATVRSE
jgi:pyridoxine/pyridoxamine 5'-phosphate oxidase